MLVKQKTTGKTEEMSYSVPIKGAKHRMDKTFPGKYTRDCFECGYEHPGKKILKFYLEALLVKYKIKLRY